MEIFIIVLCVIMGVIVIVGLLIMGDPRCFYCRGKTSADNHLFHIGVYHYSGSDGYTYHKDCLVHVLGHPEECKQFVDRALKIEELISHQHGEEEMILTKIEREMHNKEEKLKKAKVRASRVSKAFARRKDGW